MLPRFSLIIPPYNEERLLGRVLDSVDAARTAYGRGDAIEVIVADNASTDRTAVIAATRGCRGRHRLRVTSSPSAGRRPR